MANNRIHYAAQRIGIAPIGSTTYSTIRGVQSCGITTTFNLEQVFEWGQVAIYENIEGVPDVEVTIERVMDGWCPAYLLATQADSAGVALVAGKATLIGRSVGKCIMGMAIYDESVSYAEGTPGTQIQMSGLYVSSVGYSVSVDANATENLTLVGNNKLWVVGGDTENFVDTFQDNVWPDNPWSTGSTNPQSISGSGGVNRREDVIFGSTGTPSLIPTQIAGAHPSGWNILTNGVYPVHMQSWSINTDLGREELFELGRRGTYYRYMNLPVEVTNEITIISSSGDLVSSSEEGVYQQAGSEAWACGGRYNLKNEHLRLVLCEGLQVDCGSSNKLSSVGVSGGDAGGGNVEITYTYTNFNEMTVQHPADVNTALRP